MFWKKRIKSINGKEFTLCRIGHRGQKFACYFWFVGWSCLSIGLHVDVAKCHIQIHIPFGFIHIGKPM